MEGGGEKRGFGSARQVRAWYLGMAPSAGPDGGQGSSPVQGDPEGQKSCAVWPLSSPSPPLRMYTILGHLPPDLPHT